jgi:hypothetical protein
MSDNINMKEILDEINNISSKIINKLDSLENRVTKIEKKIDMINNKNITNQIIDENLVELKQEDLNIDQSDVFKAIEYRDYRSIMYIFKLYYKTKTNETYAYPIRIIGKRKFSYYDNKQWNNDSFGHHCINVIFQNIQNLFIKFNDMELYDISYEDFIKNQTFICKLINDKYKRDIFKNIIEEVRINNT